MGLGVAGNGRFLRVGMELRLAVLGNLSGWLDEVEGEG